MIWLPSPSQSRRLSLARGALKIARRTGYDFLLSVRQLLSLSAAHGLRALRLCNVGSWQVPARVTTCLGGRRRKP
jgi:hypothetical protein